jgi:outer membrane protein assembly factor BamB
MVVFLSSCGADSTQTRSSVSTSGPSPASAPASTGGDVSTTAQAMTPLAECAAGSLPAAGAFDATNGSLEWIACSVEDAWRSVLGTDQSTVYVLAIRDDLSSSVSAHDRGTGSIRWSVDDVAFSSAESAGLVGHPTVVLAIGRAGDSIVGLDAATGSTQWSYDAAAAGGLQLLAAGDEVVLVGSQREMVGLDRATGNERWRSAIGMSDTSSVVVGRGSVALLDDLAFVPFGPDLIALDLATGLERWRTGALDHPDAEFGVVVGGRPSASSPSVVQTLDAATGEDRWSASGEPSYGALWALGEDVVVVVDGGEIVGRSLVDGSESWRTSRSDLPGEPQMIDGTVLVLLWEGLLGAADATTGSLLWSLDRPLGSDLMNSVDIDAGDVFVAVNSLPWGD